MLRNTLLGIGGVAAVVLFVIVALDPQPVLTGNTNQTAWDLPPLDGDERVGLADFRGTPLVAAFFADWCPHCARELPHHAAVSADLGDQVAWVGINSQNNGQGLEFAREHGIGDWPLARDIGGVNGSGLSNAFGARGMPLTVFHAADGSVAHTQIGPLNETELRGTIATLFGIES